MTNILGFVRDRLIGGLVFLLPILVLLIIGRVVLQFVAKLMQPLVSRLPDLGLPGPIVDYLMAASIILVVALFVGLLATTSFMRNFGEKMERFALERIPGFSLLKGIFQRPNDSNVKVLLVTLDEAWLFGFLLEEMADGRLAVFIPGVPVPTSGSLYFFTERQVRRTDIPVRDAVRCLTRLGVGSGRLVSGRLPADA